MVVHNIVLYETWILGPTVCAKIEDMILTVNYNNDASNRGETKNYDTEIFGERLGGG